MQREGASTVTNEVSRVLLVDDDPVVLRSYKNALTVRGFAIETARDGKTAIELIKTSPFDVIVSDISMPEMDGVEFLRAIRQYDVEVPVVLMTGEPDLHSAMRAVEHGAFRYLVKPVEPSELEELIRRAVGLHKMARLKREALELAQAGLRLGESAALESRFLSSLNRLWMAFQPIVTWREQRVFGYEALLRSDEPLMKNPGDILDAAERLDRIHELGRVIRGQVAQASKSDEQATILFVNLHAADLNDEDLYRADRPLSKLASRVVLEVTERASLAGVRDVASRIAKLKALGFRLAVDDLGAGYAGLTSFTQLEPHIAKLDMSLVRGIDGHARKQAIVRSMVKLCDEFGMSVVAEGVETTAERDTLIELGCDLLQGYLFARPERGFPTPRFDH